MLFTKNKDHRCKPGGTAASVHLVRHRHKGILLCLLAMSALAGAAPPGLQAPTNNSDRPYLIPEANRLPDANDQMKMREQKAKQQNFEAANAERRKQIAEDSAQLLKLATDLKAEVDKTTKDMLSLTVIRKADEIERLAHNMKEKMKLTVGSN
jgi:hypothetical protein